MALAAIRLPVTRLITSGWQCLHRYQRLALALGLSLLIHFVFLGSLGLHLPDWQQDRQLLEASLVTPPAPIKAPPTAKPSAIPPKKAAPLKPPAPVEPEAAPVLPPANNSVPTIMETPVEVPLVEAPPQVEAEEDIVINPNAYKYVETIFDVRTELDAKPDASPAGKASMVYELLPNGEQYQIKSLVQAKGLLALFMPDLLQTSAGFLTNKGLQPKHYLYQFGDKKNKTYSADFDWEAKKLQLHSEKGTNTLQLLDGTQDLVSFMYQFMFVPPLQSMKLTLTNGKKLGVYDYGFEGEVTLNTKLGELNTLHLIRRADEGDEKTELWLALDYQYVPVKIRKTEKDGKVYELLVTSLRTQKPASNLQ